MLPTIDNNNFPDFQADQLLTAAALNDLFGYLDEQNRLTRSNLIGVGIVCGLLPSSNAAGTEITISKGCGITSEGYLVTLPDTTYTEYREFDSLKETYYDKFVDETTNPISQRFNLYELTQAGVYDDSEVIPDGFTDDKVVLIFVELLEESNKNCDPDSCDDKGMNVTVSLHPLLIAKSDVDIFIPITSGVGVSTALSLPEVKMPRFNVGSTLLLDSADVFSAYQKILTEDFIKSVQDSLSNAYTKLFSVLSDAPVSDPFSGLSGQYEFLNVDAGTITPTQLIRIQYYYDFFSDLISAYNELRKKSRASICECCPDSSLFPRHLLLGEAFEFNELTSTYRYRFVSSTILCCCQDDLVELKILFTRLISMVNNFLIEDTGDDVSKIRITPSELSKDLLSQKAIPYYYNVEAAGDELYESWSPERTVEGTAQQNLSYHADKYNTVDDFVQNPLKYDLEDYNFLRIEGHIGQKHADVLKKLEAIRTEKRLPFDTVALSTDVMGILDILQAMQTLDFTAVMTVSTNNTILKDECCFDDLLTMFDEWLCEVQCYLNDKKDLYGAVKVGQIYTDEANAAGLSSNNADTVKDAFLILRSKISSSESWRSRILSAISSGRMTPTVGLTLVLYRINQIKAALNVSLEELDYSTFIKRVISYNELLSTLYDIYSEMKDDLKDKFADNVLPTLQETFDRCLIDKIELIIEEFLLRLFRVLLQKKFGYYATINPGLQHKAGVPIGGTFVVVYHEKTTKLSTERTTISGRVVGDTYLDDVSVKRTVNDTTREVESNESGVFSFPVGSFPVTIEFSKDGYQTKEIILYSEPTDLVVRMTSNTFQRASYSKNYLSEEFEFIDDLLSQTDEDGDSIDTSGIGDGRVIADFYLPYLCCSDCPPIQYIIQESSVASNEPPIADAGDDQIVLSTIREVTLDGGGSSDPDGTIALYSWTKVSDSSVTIETPDEKQTKVTGLVAGNEYEFKLTVTDNSGATAEDKVKVRVNQAPIALVIPDIVTINAGNTLLLMDNGSYDPDRGYLNYEWSVQEKPDDVTIHIDDTGSKQISITLSTPGSYKFQLKVTDDDGESNTDTVLVTVKANEVPIANAGDDQPNALINEQIFLDGSGSYDSDGTIVTYSWTLLPPEDPNVNIVSPSSAVSEISGVSPGNTYEFQLSVTDNNGNSDKDSVLVTVINQAPLACADPNVFIDQFETGLLIIDEKNYGSFFSRVILQTSLNNFFTGLQDMADDSAKLTFIVSYPDLVTLFKVSFTTLQGYIIESKDTSLRLLSLATYRILLDLCMFVECNSKVDLKQTPPEKFWEVFVGDADFQGIVNQVLDWPEYSFDGPDKDQITWMEGDVAMEISRLDSRIGEAPKPEYLEVLGYIDNSLLSFLD